MDVYNVILINIHVHNVNKHNIFCMEISQHVNINVRLINVLHVLTPHFVINVYMIIILIFIHCNVKKCSSLIHINILMLLIDRIICYLRIRKLNL